MLEFRDLSVGYEGKTVLSKFDLGLKAGQIYTIVGKNGCGKSTLLRTAAGLLEPLGGEVMINGKNLKDHTPTERARTLSYLTQSRTVPNITAERLIAHGRFPHLESPKKLKHEDWEIIDESMERMHVDSFRNTSLCELSGGERQRVYLAMQLVQNVPIMLLDEPTTYMDIEYQLFLMEFLTRLKYQGKTIVMVLHDLDQALRFSDQIIAIDSADKIHVGTPKKILAEEILTKIFHIEVLSNSYQFCRSLDSGL